MMVQFLNPAGLWLLGTMLIPVLIHLWNVKTGKTLKVGSISLIGESSKQNSRSLRLRDLFLLLLRCLVIAAASFILAQPFIYQDKPDSKQSAWVLIPGQRPAEAYHAFSREIDSILNSGAELRLFQPGFPEAELKDLKSDTIDRSREESWSYWTLAKTLIDEAPQNTRMFLYTDNYQRNFRGDRPSVSVPLSWKTYTPPDSVARFVSDAYFTPAGMIRTVITTTSPGMNSNVVVESEATGDEQVRTEIKDGAVYASLRNAGPAADLLVDTATLRIGYYSDSQADLHYLRLAIDAIREYSSKKISFEAIDKNSVEKYQLIFWLSPTDPQEIITTMRSGSSIFQYAGGKPVATHSRIMGSPALFADLSKRIEYKGSGAFSGWKDGFGDPVLDLTPGRVDVYKFYSRFDPGWTDLVWKPDFVKMIMPLLNPEKNGGLSRDKRIVDEKQIAPAEIGSAPMKASKKIMLTDYFWLALALAFIIERFISFRRYA